MLTSLVTFALSVQLEIFQNWALPRTLIVDVFDLYLTSFVPEGNLHGLAVRAGLS